MDMSLGDMVKAWLECRKRSSSQQCNYICRKCEYGRLPMTMRAWDSAVMSFKLLIEEQLRKEASGNEDLSKQLAKCNADLELEEMYRQMLKRMSNNE